ncbi:M48 family metalloprotease [Burkholderia cepacia]|uniref:M48 family metalloprotease n=1 Tax=Burkholderia TaxID=32008 RepID=UPI001591E3C7|nr:MULTISPECIES: M48 family metalloprotease [Burkholderia]MCA8218989.1 M48 family metalloprotease [Burkholderia cepacia]MCA8232101.1 M48 family metalloprotease [Burkholderia vietnamiensis]
MSSALTSPRTARYFLAGLIALFLFCTVLLVLHNKLDWFGPVVAQIAAIGFLILALPCLVAGKHVLNSIEASTGNVTLKPDDSLLDVVRPLVADLPYDVRVCQYELNQVNAFAISSVFGRKALIAFSSRMVKESSSKQLTAFAAHEVAHLKHGDSRDKALLIAYYEALQIYPRLFSEFGKIVLKQVLPAIALLFVLAIALVAFFAGPLQAAHAAAPLLLQLTRYVIIAAAFIVGFVYLERTLMKKYFEYSRAREYEADAAAAAMTSAEDMVSALKLLHAPAAAVGVFDTHPPLNERIARLSN